MMDIVIMIEVALYLINMKEGMSVAYWKVLIVPLFDDDVLTAKII
jgi:hypothetical protein